MASRAASPASDKAVTISSETFKTLRIDSDPRLNPELLAAYKQKTVVFFCQPWGTLLKCTFDFSPTVYQLEWFFENVINDVPENDRVLELSAQGCNFSALTTEEKDRYRPFWGLPGPSHFVQTARLMIPEWCNAIDVCPKCSSERWMKVWYCWTKGSSANMEGAASTALLYLKSWCFQCLRVAGIPRPFPCSREFRWFNLGRCPRTQQAVLICVDSAWHVLPSPYLQMSPSDEFWNHTLFQRGATHTVDDDGYRLTVLPSIDDLGAVHSEDSVESSRLAGQAAYMRLD